MGQNSSAAWETIVIKTVLGLCSANAIFVIHLGLNQLHTRLLSIIFAQLTCRSSSFCAPFRNFTSLNSFTTLSSQYLRNILPLLFIAYYHVILSCVILCYVILPYYFVIVIVIVNTTSYIAPLVASHF